MTQRAMKLFFFDESSLSTENEGNHERNEKVILQALNHNSKERSRRFESINTHKSPEKIHDEVLIRSVALFEPRPELNHATNTLCIVGRRSLTTRSVSRQTFFHEFV